MKTVTSTEAQQNFGDTLNQSIVEPITIQKHKKDFAVLISATRFQELEKLEEALEDNLLAAMATQAVEEGLASQAESAAILNSIRHA